MSVRKGSHVDRQAKACRGNKVCEGLKKGCVRGPGTEKMSLQLGVWLMGEGGRQREDRELS